MTKALAGKQPTDQTEIDLINQTLTNKGVSINTLADETGIPFATLRRSLKNGRPLNLLELRKIAAALNVWPSDILPADLTTKEEDAA